MAIAATVESRVYNETAMALDFRSMRKQTGDRRSRRHKVVGFNKITMTAAERSGFLPGRLVLVYRVIACGQCCFDKHVATA